MRSQQRCEIYWLGQVDYDTAWALQNQIADEIHRGQRPATLLLLEHPHVFTIGRRGSRAHILWDEAECARRAVILREVDRGGDVTYHGPGQLVGYPILPLAQPNWEGERLPQIDFIGYLRKLEDLLIRLLETYGIVAYRREGLTGVWVTLSSPTPPAQPAKIASIGVKVDRFGISRHGFALNVAPQMDYWSGIVPCGLEGVRMTSLAELLPSPPSLLTLAVRTARIFSTLFEYEPAPLSDGRGLTTIQSSNL
ncbi:lipoyl(octanoyl) transferase LipB [uncultured Thermanaerothrix sp.]|uniref:lipoyl(octanoyl) transferase LipB n=1 Tax=uncultured Thermanaerothrix sp. TaxID=1195149 RepID=UPI00263291B3|nr:lipoyl(octanoyl) transferase LipB [uncultured Thermanaerothrix sp.]